MGQLQLIFARLQFSLKSFVDPTQFVKSLDLDVSQQQDAQEFSKLFLTLIEEDLRNQKNNEVKNIVQTQYCGEYVYITKCLNCHKESKTPSTFYELGLIIKSKVNNIYDCLEDFFAPEQLEDSNQVYCNNCNNKQNVERYIKLQKLPPFLNLQLLRFVFDRQKGRKKLNSSVRFPEKLNLENYFDDSSMAPKKAEYKLCAVLMHRGQSCFSGHYIAQIKDRISGNWFKFNDETVEKIDSKNLKLGSDDTNSTESISKGYHSSDDAYMLVYKDVSLDDSSFPPDSSDKWDIPDYLQEILLDDNSKFEESIKLHNQIKNQNLALNKEKQIEVKSVYEELIKNENADDCEWIDREWLKDWLSNDLTDINKPVQQINNSKATCIHSKLAISEVDKMKLVNSKAMDILFDKYSGGPRLKDACCRECVETKVRSIQTRLKINNDSKQITSKLKFSLPINESSFWVGKESLKVWKQLALKQCDLYEKSLLNSEFQTENINSPSSNQSKNNSLSSSENGDSDTENIKPQINSPMISLTTPVEDNLDSTNEKSNFNFNQDILCVHNGLNPGKFRISMILLII